MTITPDKIVQRTIQTMIQNKDISENDLISALEKDEMSISDAYQAVIFVPVAFTRVLLKDKGVYFPDYFIVSLKDDEEKCYSLMDNAIYVAALEYGANWQSTPVTRDDFMQIASRSADFNAINNALHNGAKLENLVMAPPFIIDGEWNLTQPEIEHPHPPKKRHFYQKWWNRWGLKN